MKIFLWTIGTIIVGGAFLFFLKEFRDNEPSVREPGQFDTLAQCIKDSGAVFYGAYWCPHCQEQKAEFGPSASLLPYVECSTPSGTGQSRACADKKITGYPTWTLSDGTILEGKQTMSDLAEKTGCVLPGEKKAATSTPDTADIPTDENPSL